MKSKSFSFSSATPGLKLSGKIYKPSKIESVVVIVHGFMDKKEAYDEIASVLAENNLLVYTYDQRGHGESVKNKLDLGYFYDKTATAIVVDLYLLISKIKKEYPEKKIYLIGHSMGTLVINSFIKEHDNLIDGIILSGMPKHSSNDRPNLFYAKAMALLNKDYYRGPLTKRINPTSKDDVTLNALINVYSLLKDVYNKKNWNLNNPKLNFYYLYGTNDKVVGNEKNIKFTIDHFKNIGYKNINIKEYKNESHNMIKKNKDITNDIINWIKKGDK